jgi:cytochrome c
METGRRTTEAAMTLRTRFTLSAAVLVLSLPTAAVAGAQGTGEADGKLLFNNACRTCHTVNEGDNRLGPSLHGIVGRPSGSLEGVNYSGALAGGAVTFDEATLDRFIENPDAVAPGHGMKPFGGVSSPEERAAIIAFLKETGDAGGG